MAFFHAAQQPDCAFRLGMGYSPDWGVPFRPEQAADVCLGVV